MTGGGVGFGGGGGGYGGINIGGGPPSWTGIGGPQLGMGAIGASPILKLALLPRYLRSSFALSRLPALPAHPLYARPYRGRFGNPTTSYGFDPDT